MADLIIELELALEKVVKLGNRGAVNIIKKAIQQAKRISAAK
jgi:hypothetical protein